MLNMLLNGIDKQEYAERALPPLADQRVEKIARILAKQNRQDPDAKDSGNVCLDDCVGDGNAWRVGRLTNGDPYVYCWMRYIEQAAEILEAI